jgi:hypothetical protein
MPKRANFDPKRIFNNAVLRRDMSGGPTTATDTQVMAGSGLLLSPGLGAAFSSPDEFSHLTGRPVLGLGLSEVSQKLKSLKSSKFSKPKNISFTL